MNSRNQTPNSLLHARPRFESVVIGTSLTTSSDEFVRAALALTRALRAKIRLVHVLPLEPIACGVEGVFASDVLEALRQQQVDDLARQVHETGILERELLGVDIVTGAPHQALSLAAHSADVDLIIVGASEDDSSERLLGSTADRVMRSAHCPVLILRDGLRLPPLRVLAPVDFSTTSGQALEAGALLLEQLGADESSAIQTLFVLSPIQRQLASQFSPEQIDRLAKEELVRFTFEHTEVWKGTIETKVRIGEARHQVLQELGESPVDLIVVGSQGHGFLHRALIGSVAGRLARRASCSVLVVPGCREESMLEQQGVEKPPFVAGESQHSADVSAALPG